MNASPPPCRIGIEVQQCKHLCYIGHSDSRMEARSACGRKILVISGDFDGDGREDKAMLLVTADGSRYGLFVFLAERRGFRTERIFDRDVRGLSGVSIGRVPPGQYPTLCGQGYYACAKGEDKDINPYYYWNRKLHIGAQSVS